MIIQLSKLSAPNSHNLSCLSGVCCASTDHYCITKTGNMTLYVKRKMKHDISLSVIWPTNVVTGRNFCWFLPTRRKCLVKIACRGPPCDVTGEVLWRSSPIDFYDNIELFTNKLGSNLWHSCKYEAILLQSSTLIQLAKTICGANFARENNLWSVFFPLWVIGPLKEAAFLNHKLPKTCIFCLFEEPTSSESNDVIDDAGAIKANLWLPKAMRESRFN